MNLQRAVYDAPPQLEQADSVAPPQPVISPPQHQIGKRENQRREILPVAHEEELVAVEEGVVVEVVVEDVYMEEGKYDGHMV